MLYQKQKDSPLARETVFQQFSWFFMIFSSGLKAIIRQIPKVDGATYFINYHINKNFQSIRNPIIDNLCRQDSF